MYKLYFKFTFLFLLCFYTLESQTNNITLLEINSDWEFSQAGLDEWLNAKVPGTVHTDLLFNDKIKDPFYRTNEKDLQWIDKVDWVYRTKFNVENNLFSKKNIDILFHGLDTYADVFLNGKQILSADNMFRTWRADVKDLIKEGENLLVVYFHSPIQTALVEMKEYGIRLPASNDQSENGQLGPNRVSIFTRKAGYHYGWDWGPRFVTSGIWKPVEIQAWNDLRIDNVFIKQSQVNKKSASLIADVKLNVEASTNAEVVVVNLSDNKELVRQSVTLDKGNNNVALPFIIRNPRLWWSNGLGEPDMYNFKVTVNTTNGIIASSVIKTGLRELKLVRKADKNGESFYFELNGVSVFAKGANYIPSDMFLPRVSNDEYRKIITDARNANINMIRVWGGGIYENDIFYDLCDEMGIMVWQDFMFACSMYPGTEQYLNNVREEAVCNIVRLRNHPSIALWCGNNEINTAWSYYNDGGWGWKQQYDEPTREKINNSYKKIFHEILPAVVSEYTDGDDYWPSSPQAGYKDSEHASYQTLNSGDQHYWGVWHGLHPFEDFGKYVGRFMSEFGFQSFPEFETVKKYTIPEDWNIESEVMAAHQRSGIGNLRIKEYMALDYEVPEDFEQFLYLSHVLQARGISIGVETYRRNMPHCMGSLYWQLNDCWPVASWSGTDYYRNWKALHYFIRKAYQPTIISMSTKDDQVELYVVSDELTDINAQLNIELVTFNGKIVNKIEKKIKVKANTSTLAFVAKIDELLSGNDKRDVVASVSLKKGDKELTDYLYYFAKPKELNLLQPEVHITVSKEEKTNYVYLSSNTLIKNIMLFIPGEDSHFSDNYFDVIPGKTYRISVISNLDIDEIKNKLRFRHLKTAVSE